MVGDVAPCGSAALLSGLFMSAHVMERQMIAAGLRGPPSMAGGILIGAEAEVIACDDYRPARCSQRPEGSAKGCQKLH